ncbi:MAG: histidine kinase dimerization/phospho-acceptor domain-containing protein [Desulfobacterales bacterium]|nr:histidine kinase dimerization/phospho-acceptor domain-containing protein [Desulfobacterales bacterium]
MRKNRRRHAGLISLLLVVTGVLLYITLLDREHEFFYHLDVIFQSLFFIPVVLACLWFGLRGGLFVSFMVVLIMIPYVILHWEGLSGNDLNRMLQKITYVAAALILGKVIERQRREQERAKEAERLAAIGMSMAAVAHDLKTPLISIGGFSRLVRKHLSEDFPHLDKLDIVIAETRRMEAMVGDILHYQERRRGTGPRNRKEHYRGPSGTPCD